MAASVVLLFFVFSYCATLKMSKDKRLTVAELSARDTMAIMGDEDSVTGFLIAGRCTARPSQVIVWLMLYSLFWLLFFDSLIV